MKLKHYTWVVVTNCRGCMCHEMDMVFAGGREGCCGECGCPTTLDAFWELYWEQNPIYGTWAS